MKVVIVAEIVNGEEMDEDDIEVSIESYLDNEIDNVDIYNQSENGDPDATFHLTIKEHKIVPDDYVLA
jgi:hypothetical protein